MTAATARGTLMAAALVTVVITVSGSGLGLIRDVLLARFFGADGATDAFLVAWTVPETAFCLVVEGAMSLVMVPLFSRTLARQGSVRDLVAATLPRVTVALLIGSAAVLLGAPLLVHAVAPGLADPALAVTCTRLTATTVLGFGLAGYLSAALRAHHVFAAPAAIHLASNAGIIGLMWTLHGRLGVVSAAAGVALGGALMVAVQLPSYLRHVGLPHPLHVGLPHPGRWLRGATRPVGALALGAVAPVVVYTLGRQSQVYVERFLGSGLPAGAITHLNYAQKLTQLPMLVALLICTVTFPTLARCVAAGDLAGARRRFAADLRLVTVLILLGSAYLVVFAPEVVQCLLERGAFGVADTTSVAALVRVCAVGLLGHAMVGVAVRPYFADGGRAWLPAVAVGVGVAVNAAVAALSVAHLGAVGIAAGNGAGIATAAVLLLVGLRRRDLAVPLRETAWTTARAVLAAAAAAGAGWLAGRLLEDLGSTVVSVAGGVVVLGAFAVAARLVGFDEVGALVSELGRRARRGR
ncbi:lipid II flippase MurJ [Dactylosporangium siamense]|uniref:Membrane protein n=1 Tax=Dactylosporangium siamense TaxID=685454 RepID=A0A919U5X8_9ACTN|nr:lipid II flippase MurJ [Dactylosporangium siamense]GIG43809.1 membrane protein [Dactylosporangium siamense]